MLSSYHERPRTIDVLAIASSHVGESDISTACTMLLAIVGFMILYRISSPMNMLRCGIWGGCIIALGVCSICLGDLFAIEKMSKSCVMLFVVFAIATEPVLRYSTMLVEKIRGLITRKKQREC